jgi:hypothetical protein
MPEGYIVMLGGGIRATVNRLRDRREQRQEMAAAPDAEHVGADLTPRATPRQEAFDAGDDVLPCYSTDPLYPGWGRGRS